MSSVVFVLFGSDFVTIAATCSVANGMTIRIGSTITVHFVGIVTSDTVHRVWHIVYVGAVAFIAALILITDAAAVTGRTLIGEVG